MCLSAHGITGFTIFKGSFVRGLTSRLITVVCATFFLCRSFCGNSDGELVRRVANLCIRALNAVAGFTVLDEAQVRCAPQRAVRHRALRKASRWVGAMLDNSSLDPLSAFGRLVHDDALSQSAVARPTLDAARCDLLDKSGLVDPLPHIGADDRAVVETPQALFGGGSLDWIKGAQINKSDRPEYARLVARQLRCHKVSLLPATLSSASVFAVGKSSGGLREVWNGHDLSTAARPPPKPPHLAGVTAMLDLEAGHNHPIVAYKRDARCFFDQLHLGDSLRPYFGRPTLTAGDILRFTDMTADELGLHLW